MFLSGSCRVVPLLVVGGLRCDYAVRQSLCFLCDASVLLCALCAAVHSDMMCLVCLCRVGASLAAAHPLHYVTLYLKPSCLGFLGMACLSTAYHSPSMLWGMSAHWWSPSHRWPGMWCGSAEPFSPVIPTHQSTITTYKVPLWPLRCSSACGYLGMSRSFRKSVLSAQSYSRGRCFATLLYLPGLNK
jgi:hypothetical protein